VISNTDFGRLSVGPDYVSDGLVLYLDAASKRSYGSGSTWQDISGKGNNFTIAGSPTHQGKYFELDGTTAKYFQAYPFAHPTHDFTVELFLRIDTFSQTALYSYAVAGDDNEGLLYAPGGLIYIYGPSGGGSTGYTLSEDAFHQIVRTRAYSSGQEKLYVDGILVATMTIAAGTTTETNGSFNVGQEQDSPGGGFSPTQAMDGDVSIIKVYEKALSSGEVFKNYTDMQVRFLRGV